MVNTYLRAVWDVCTRVFMHPHVRAVSCVSLACRWWLQALGTSDRWQLGPATWIQPSPWEGSWQSEAERTAERGHWLWGQGRSGDLWAATEQQRKPSEVPGAQAQPLTHLVRVRERVLASPSWR